MIRNASIVLFVLFMSLSGAAAARADESGAQKYLEQAQKQAADKDPADKIETSLKLVEVELDGVDPAKKEPIVKAIAAVRVQVKAGEMEAFKKNVGRELAQMFMTAESLLGVRQAGINDQLDTIDKLLADPKTVEALGAGEVDAQKKKLATFRKVSADKMAENDLAAATRGVEALEKDFPEMQADLKGSPASQAGAAQKMERRYAQFQTDVKDLPKDNPAVVALTARMNKMQAEVNAAYGAVMVAEVLDRLKRNWEIDAPEFAGWEAENAPPKFTQLVTQQSEATSKLGAPKTVRAASRARQFQESLAGNDQAKPLSQTPPLKDFIDSINKLKTDTEAKLVTFADAILADAETAPLDKNGRDRMESFVQYDLVGALPGHPQLASLQERGTKLVGQFDQTAAAGADAKSAEYQKRLSDAAARWPDLIKNLKADEAFDPAKADAFKGRLLRFKNVRNRAGWDYGAEGGFDFAMAIDGKPFAARYSPGVKEAVADLTAKTGKPLPEETDYDVYAVYEGKTGKLMRREDINDKITAGSSELKLTGEYKVPVDVPVLTIVGLYCGPVAVYDTKTADTIVPSDGYGFGSRLLDLLLMLVAALAVLLKAQFAPVMSVPQLGSARANLTGRNQTIIGAALLGMALLMLLRGYVIYGLLGNLALAAAGLYLALDLLEKQSWWKPDYSAKLNGLAVPIGLACAVLGVVRLLLGPMMFV